MKKTLPRDTIYLAQTPQAFRRDVLARAIAHGRSGAEGTDEAALAEQLGSTVLLVPGDPRNIKITTTADLAFARGLLLERGEPREPRSHGGLTPRRRGEHGESEVCLRRFEAHGRSRCGHAGYARSPSARVSVAILRVSVAKFSVFSVAR